ncbi:unnamed protein product [Paramecium sonneborni]|uniref:Uncharacterized protein n=1 Tax=Paramecium sonneborni TaxID=65129 RepID=A0A8S1P1M3_9CILI|nr:unnamed protein product [Paramecium sonneborni]
MYESQLLNFSEIQTIILESYLCNIIVSNRRNDGWRINLIQKKLKKNLLYQEHQMKVKKIRRRRVKKLISFLNLVIIKKYETTYCFGCKSIFEDVILTLFDFNFCVWKHNVIFPIFESLIMKQAQITCGGFSPYRAGVIIIGKTDGNLDVWDMLDQSHKWTLQFQVVACAITSLKFNDNMAHIVAVGDSDDLGIEVKAMRLFWEREVKRVNYYSDRFKVRESQAKQQIEREIQAQHVKENKQSGDTKVLDETANFENEYQKFKDALLGVGVKPEDENCYKRQEMNKGYIQNLNYY